jgi:hypothetical protein
MCCRCICYPVCLLGQPVLRCCIACNHVSTILSDSDPLGAVDPIVDPDEDEADELAALEVNGRCASGCERSQYHLGRHDHMAEGWQ